jgi:hypothetical protein
MDSERGFPESSNLDVEPHESSPNVVVHRSCYSCHAKKIRCDKLKPCSSCNRGGKVCNYPPPGARQRRTKKTIVSNLTSRISYLEQTLARVKDQSSKQASELAPLTTFQSETPKRASMADLFVQQGSSIQYFNELLLSKAISGEQGQDKELFLSFSHSKTTQSSALSPFSGLGILSSPSPSIIPSNLHPSKKLALRLWGIYETNAEICLGFKLIHFPSTEAIIYGTIDDPSSCLLENLALSFAIYYVAVLAIPDSDVDSVLEQNKHSLLIQFKLGLEQSFARGDFLDCPTLTGLHALSIYLSGLRIHNRGKGAWILNGLAVRIGQSLGLHRDGEKLGLSPFQSEIRRRLWWHLINRDGRSGEDYGLEHSNGLIPISEVTLPLNVDDTDLHPSMDRLPPAKESWTGMTFVLINIEVAQGIQKLAAIASKSSPSSPPSEELRVQILQHTRLRIEKLQSFCNPVIPRQRLTLQCSRFLLRKYEFSTRLQWTLLQMACNQPQKQFVTEQNLTEALELMEARLSGEDGVSGQFAWLRHAHPQYNVMIYVLCHLCLKPDGPNTHRAWEIVDRLLPREPFNQQSMGFESKFTVLNTLWTKAMTLRDKLPKYLEKNKRIDKAENSYQAQQLHGHIIENQSNSDVGLDNGSNEWLNWSAMIQAFQFDQPGASW